MFKNLYVSPFSVWNLRFYVHIHIEIEIMDFKFVCFYWKFIAINTPKTAKLGKLTVVLK